MKCLHDVGIKTNTLLKNVSQQSRFTGINIKLGQGNFTVAVKFVRNLSSAVLYTFFPIGSEIVLYCFKEPNLVFQGLQLIEKTHTCVFLKAKKRRDKTCLLLLRLPGPWFYIQNLSNEQLLHNSRHLEVTLALAHPEYNPKHRVCKQPICCDVSKFLGISPKSLLVFSSQMEFGRKTGGTATSHH